ncbi:MAG: amidohydrolase [Deltaproteobacteria bacterium]|jgi:amidohydrolase|nr:amidohydrolase [Deltaproteobacteria bacterium]MBP1718045.1 amidohydrolase [Deltaproteobacteria bacterium]
MNKDILKQSACHFIDENREKIIGWAREIDRHPELGFKETKTAELVSSALHSFGLPVRKGLAVTGVEGVLTGVRPGPGLLIMGEMDSVVNRDYPGADPITGAAHLCGHHLQVAIMLGAALGLNSAGADKELSGTIFFLGTPAEEFVEIEERLRLRDEGKIRYLGGKQELIRQGYLQQIQMAMIVHAHSDLPDRKILFGGSGNGFMAKSVQFRGKAAHAGVSPHEGINALNAACLAMVNIHFQRETFRDEDSIRVHPIITKGGDVVNVVPPDVRLETYVRGRRVEAILDASKKVDRAIHAGAEAVGAEVTIRNIPGYLPLIQNSDLTSLARQNAVSIAGQEGVGEGGFMGGSTDAGDLAHLIPTIQPYAGGVQGLLHSSGFKVIDYDSAVIYPAKVMAMTAIDLLYGDAGEARRVIENFKPAMRIDDYLAFLEEMTR